MGFPAGGSGSSTPSGPAGGDLAGTYPNPTIGTGKAASNVGALGGVLGGTLPNPSMAAGAAATNIGAHGVTSLMLAAEFLAIGRPVASGTSHIAVTSTSPQVCALGSKGGVAGGNLSASNAGASDACFYFDPALYALTGLTTKLQVYVMCFVNNTAPAVTFTAGLYPATSASSGTAGSNTITLGAVIAGSTTTFTTPAANSITSQGSGTFNASLAAAGMYVFGIDLNSGTTAANSGTAFTAYLVVSWV